MFPLFSPRYDFRKRIAEVLELDKSQVTILAGSPRSAVGGKCQQVDFMVSGETETPLKIPV